MQAETTVEMGLVVQNLAKTYGKHASSRRLFEDISFSLPKGGRLAVLGRNGQGKSTLIKILGGVLPQTTGSISWGMSASWPIGFGGGLQGSLTGYDNIRFISRLYNTDYNEMFERVEGFAELGPALSKPAKQYSSGMRARLVFGLSLAIEFDCYLIDELVAVGDARFQEKCNTELFEHRADRAFIMASHDMHLISRNCDQALVIESGQARMFDDIEEAIDVYTWLRAP